MPIDEIVGIAGSFAGAVLAALMGYRKLSAASKVLWRRIGIDGEDPDGMSLGERIRETHRMAIRHEARFADLDRVEAERTERSNDRAERIAKLEYLAKQLEAKGCLRDGCGPI